MPMLVHMAAQRLLLGVLEAAHGWSDAPSGCPWGPYGCSEAAFGALRAAYGRSEAPYWLPIGLHMAAQRLHLAAEGLHFAAEGLSMAPMRQIRSISCIWQGQAAGDGKWFLLGLDSWQWRLKTAKCMPQGSRLKDQT